MEPLDSYARRIARQIVSNDLSQCDGCLDGKSNAGDRLVSEYKIPRLVAEDAVLVVRAEIEGKS